ncbi:MAG: 50S ribosomal protein L15 [Lentisphaeraceae bacterium]|nr:50S ribosomal protein L15 [Lentisphaeraceae bacterium]
MKLSSLNNPKGYKRRKRVGRGDSSGLGRTCGRGEKGQKSRSGSKIRLHFEGGQIPLFRRLPHIRGFKARNHKNWTCVNVSDIEKAFEAGDVVDSAALIDKKIISAIDHGLKILADGEISKSITVKADAFSKTAQSKIEAAGGKCELAQ